MASYKVETCLKKKKPTPSTNIPLLSYRKSEQKENIPMQNSPPFSTLFFWLRQKKLSFKTRNMSVFKH